MSNDITSTVNVAEYEGEWFSYINELSGVGIYALGGSIGIDIVDIEGTLPLTISGSVNPTYEEFSDTLPYRLGGNLNVFPTIIEADPLFILDGSIDGVSTVEAVISNDLPYALESGITAKTDKIARLNNRLSYQLSSNITGYYIFTNELDNQLPLIVSGNIHAVEVSDGGLTGVLPYLSVLDGYFYSERTGSYVLRYGSSCPSDEGEDHHGFGMDSVFFSEFLDICIECGFPDMVERLHLSEGWRHNIEVGLVSSCTVTDDFGFLGGISDSVLISDSGSWVYGRGFDDPVGFNDNTSVGVGYFKNEVISFYDVDIFDLSVGRTDTVNVADGFSYGFDLTNTDNIYVTDSIILSDSIPLSDSVDISDSLFVTPNPVILDIFLNTDVLRTAFDVAYSETVITSDVCDLLISYNLSAQINTLDVLAVEIESIFGDTVTIAEDFSSVSIFAKALSDSISNTDDCLVSVNKPPLDLADTLTISDSFDGQCTFPRNEQLNLLDDFDLSFNVGLQDSLTPVDNLSGLLGVNKADSFTVSEQQIAFEFGFTDLVVNSESRVLAISSVLQNSIVLAEAAALNLDMPLTDQVSISDSYTFDFGRSDAVSVTDVFNYELGRPFLDELVLTDDIIPSSGFGAPVASTAGFGQASFGDPT